MIGQTTLIAQLQKQITDGTFPRFTILTGAKGSGKKTLAEQIRSMLGCMVYKIADVRIESIRWLIQEAYKTRVPAVYIISDADEMSVNAKNALLKVTEEPPNKAYFIMTLEDENNTLETIRSRATIYSMENYTQDELVEYIKANYAVEATTNVMNTLLLLGSTPGEINTLMQMKGGVCEFYKYVEKVVQNIATVSGANCFKIADKVAFKEDDEGYDIKLFWKAFCTVCQYGATHTEDKEEVQRYANGELLTSNYIKDLKLKSVNKRMLFDHWILAIRRLWM